MHGSLVLCVLSPYIQGLFGQHHATLNIWLRTVVRLTGEREHAKAKLEVKGYAFLESLEQNWAGPQLLNAGAWVCCHAWPSLDAAILHACGYCHAWIVTRSSDPVIEPHSGMSILGTFLWLLSRGQPLC